MGRVVRLQHRIVEDGRFHAYLSPDIRGLYVTGRTVAEARREVVAVVDAIARARGQEKPEIEFLEDVAA